MYVLESAFALGQPQFHPGIGSLPEDYGCVLEAVTEHGHVFQCPVRVPGITCSPLKGNQIPVPETDEMQFRCIVPHPPQENGEPPPPGNGSRNERPPKDEHPTRHRNRAGTIPPRSVSFSECWGELLRSGRVPSGCEAPLLVLGIAAVILILLVSP